LFAEPTKQATLLVVGVYAATVVLVTPKMTSSNCYAEEFQMCSVSEVAEHLRPRQKNFKI